MCDAPCNTDSYGGSSLTTSNDDNNDVPVAVVVASAGQVLHYYDHLELRPPLPKKLPVCVKALILQCMHRDPAKRPRMKEVLSQLEQAVPEMESLYYRSRKLTATTTFVPMSCFLGIDGVSIRMVDDDNEEVDQDNTVVEVVHLDEAPKKEIELGLTN